MSFENYTKERKFNKKVPNFFDVSIVENQKLCHTQDNKKNSFDFVDK